MESLAVLRNGGKLVEVGFVEPFFQAPFYDIVVREKQILGSRASSRSDFREVVDLVNRGKIDPSIGESIPISQVNKALENLKNGKYLTRNALVLPFWTREGWTLQGNDIGKGSSASGHRPLPGSKNSR